MTVRKDSIVHQEVTVLHLPIEILSHSIFSLLLLCMSNYFLINKNATSN